MSTEQVIPVIGSILNKSHDHADARLRCQDCDDLICPKCMVQCAVGSRCKKCADRFSSHVVKASPAILVRTGIAASVISFVFGNYVNSIHGFGFMSWLVLIAVGVCAGKLLHRISSYKLGTKIAVAVIAGLIAGLLVSPARDTTFMYLSAAAQPVAEETSAEALLNIAMMHIAAMLLFIGATVSPFFNK